MENQLNEWMFLFVAPWLHQLKNSNFLLHWLINSYIFVLPYWRWRKGFFNNVCKEEETSFWRFRSHYCRKSWWQDEVTRHYWYCPHRSRRGQSCPRGERVDSPRRHAAITVSTCSGSSVRPMNALPSTHNGTHCKAILSIGPYPWGKYIRNTTACGTWNAHSA